MLIKYTRGFIWYLLYIFSLTTALAVDGSGDLYGPAPVFDSGIFNQYGNETFGCQEVCTFVNGERFCFSQCGSIEDKIPDGLDGINANAELGGDAKKPAGNVLIPGESIPDTGQEGAILSGEAGEANMGDLIQAPEIPDTSPGQAVPFTPEAISVEPNLVIPTPPDSN
ncbi:MAG: hypothetical protein AAF385_14450 [Pseudomonadota bacterium]